MSARSAIDTQIHGSQDRSSEVFSERLLALMDDILAGRAPNAGRFCGNCYHPLAANRAECLHCGASVIQRTAVAALPREVLQLHRLRRSREGLVVRTVAWGGLTSGVVVALLPFVFWPVTWWSVMSFFGLLIFFYLLSANLANSLGDAWGYAWGQATVIRHWTRFVAERDRGLS